MRQIGRWVGRPRHTVGQFREQLGQEVDAINEPTPEQTHPDAQIYFALNWTESPVVAHSPCETQPTGDGQQAFAAHRETQGALRPQLQRAQRLRNRSPTPTRSDLFSRTITAEEKHG
jgi:hypothetical protein